MIGARRRPATAATGRREGRAGIAAGAARTARRGLWRLSRLVETAAWVVAAIIVATILLIDLGANQSNQIVKAVTDAGKFLAGPFKDMFKLHNHDWRVAVNYGIAAVVYVVAGGIIARLLRR
jgi:hypothetical protein